MDAFRANRNKGKRKQSQKEREDFKRLVTTTTSPTTTSTLTPLPLPSFEPPILRPPVVSHDSLETILVDGTLETLPRLAPLNFPDAPRFRRESQLSSFANNGTLPTLQGQVIHPFQQQELALLEQRVFSNDVQVFSTHLKC